MRVRTNKRKGTVSLGAENKQDSENIMVLMRCLAGICPVCEAPLRELGESARDAHLNDCLPAERAKRGLPPKPIAQTTTSETAREAVVR